MIDTTPYSIRNELLTAFVEGIKRNGVSKEDALRLIDDAKNQIEKPEAPAWKPEDLIGKLVRAWDNNRPTKQSIGALGEIDNSLEWPYWIGGDPYENIIPLTEAEALELVWKPKPKTRYDWNKAPEWARFGAKDVNGQYWYEEAPYISGVGYLWIPNTGEYDKMPSSCILDASGDWRDSLERRPE